MNYIKSISDISERDIFLVGGKALALSRLKKESFRIPKTFVLTTEAYNRYIDNCGLKERILLELNRKDFKEMRWEELWDAALRIRSMFLDKPLPGDIKKEVEELLKTSFKKIPIVVRSSSPSEDASSTSFAGLHESFINLRNINSVLKHIRLVWASLWSDSALLYRQELDLDLERSSMAVVIQPLIMSTRSGIAFTQNPNNIREAVIEAVFGLNQGLVDGQIAPDRWTISRSQKKITSSYSADHQYYFAIDKEGSAKKRICGKSNSVLKENQIYDIFKRVMVLEERRGCPQDVEWTYQHNTLYFLQARPITARQEQDNDDRKWYLSLKRSFHNLWELKEKIEDDLIPSMEKEAEALSRIPLKDLETGKLFEELKRRFRIYKKWKAVYWDEFIPFAHGMRLFGQVYNDVMTPDDPFEFVELLKTGKLLSTQRNKSLLEISNYVNSHNKLKREIEVGNYTGSDSHFNHLIDRFMEQYGETFLAATGTSNSRVNIKIIYNLVSQKPIKTCKSAKNMKQMESEFINHFTDDEKPNAVKLLQLGKSSYQLRDNDNIYLGKIKAQVVKVMGMLPIRSLKQKQKKTIEMVKTELDQENSSKSNIRKKSSTMKARQLVGQPAGPGLVTGKARVIASNNDLKKIKEGEIIICDAIEPNMTFMIPLASGIVERRGGMLIHGAIIAREYGIPCVTGIPDAIQWIHTGAQITVDGYLGIVTIGKKR